MAGRDKARKRFGQNFLVDASIIDRIASRIANDQTSAATLVEIGPGRGALTAELVKTGVPLIALEIDRDLIPILHTRFSQYRNFTLQQADALQFDFSSLRASAPLRLVGNLPYNIATPLIFRLLDQLPLISDMHFMLQWEVVARLAAIADDPHYGQLSLIVQNLCEVEALFEVPGECFSPAPKVLSGFVNLRPRAQPCVPPEMQQTYTTLVKKAFAQRRKTLRNNLKSTLTTDQISAAKVDPGARAEQLTMNDFIALSQVAMEPGAR